MSADDRTPVPEGCAARFASTKTIGHEAGISAAFRQWRAGHSHCQYIHGYALSFKFTFAGQWLDERNWVVDFGDLDGVKSELRHLFDHKTVVAQDDPQLEWFKQAQDAGILQLTILENVGCEAFAKEAWKIADRWLENQNMKPRCWVTSVEVSEHGANSGIFNATGVR